MSIQPGGTPFDTFGPPDDEDVDQTVVFEESESLEPDLASADELVQEEKP